MIFTNVRFYLMLLFCLALFFTVYSQENDEFQITKPGEITFTTEMTIEGKIEKPQVIIVFSKEGTKSGADEGEASFVEDILEPVRINTFRPEREN